MFVRKLVVIVVPLLLLGLLLAVYPLLGGLGCWADLVKGLLLGVVLALVLPLSGATRKKEPFAQLLWLPLLLIMALVVCQTLWVYEIRNPVLNLLHTESGEVLLVECAVAGYLAVQCIRTRK